MRLPSSAHTSQSWRIHELTRDFRLEDVWELPVLEQPDDFGRLVQLVVEFDPAASSSFAVRTLFAARWKLGKWFGWDAAGKGLGGAERSLRERLPPDLASHPTPDFGALPFSPLYRIDDEFAAEIANGTMHGVLHLGRVADAAGRSRGQMAVLVRPHGRWGNVYMGAIKPFRHWLVYPGMFRELNERWRRRDSSPSRHDS